MGTIVGVGILVGVDIFVAVGAGKLVAVRTLDGTGDTVEAATGIFVALGSAGVVGGAVLVAVASVGTDVAVADGLDGIVGEGRSVALASVVGLGNADSTEVSPEGATKTVAVGSGKVVTGPDEDGALVDAGPQAVNKNTSSALGAANGHLFISRF